MIKNKGFKLLIASLLTVSIGSAGIAQAKSFGSTDDSSRKKKQSSSFSIGSGNKTDLRLPERKVEKTPDSSVLRFDPSVLSRKQPIDKGSGLRLGTGAALGMAAAAAAEEQEKQRQAEALKLAEQQRKAAEEKQKQQRISDAGNKQAQNRPVSGTMDTAEKTAVLMERSRQEQEAKAKAAKAAKDNVIPFPGNNVQVDSAAPYSGAGKVLTFPSTDTRAADLARNQAEIAQQQAERAKRQAELAQRRLERARESSWYRSDYRYQPRGYDNDFERNGVNPNLLAVLAATNPKAAAYMVMAQGNWLSGMTMLQFADDHDQTGALRREIEELQTQKNAGVYNPQAAPVVENTDAIITKTSEEIPPPEDYAQASDSGESHVGAVLGTITGLGLLGWAGWFVFIRRSAA